VEEGTFYEVFSGNNGYTLLFSARVTLLTVQLTLLGGYRGPSVKYANVDKKELHNGDSTHLLVSAPVATQHFYGVRSGSFGRIIRRYFSALPRLQRGDQCPGSGPTVTFLEDPSRSFRDFTRFSARCLYPWVCRKYDERVCTMRRPPMVTATSACTAAQTIADVTPHTGGTFVTPRGDHSAPRSKIEEKPCLKPTGNHCSETTPPM
jgi:hypothetical protein